MNHLDPLGVGARDLRECLLIQIAAQGREAEMVLKRAQAQTIRLMPETDGAAEGLAIQELNQ